MKKFLMLMTAGVLATSMVPSISNSIFNNKIQLNFQNPGSIHLNVPWIRGAKKNFCLPASIAMVIVSFIPGAYVDQSFVNNEVHGDISLAAPYMNRVLTGITEVSTSYFPKKYGSKKSDLLIFQESITASLSHNVPVILAYYGSGRGAYGHAIVITGIEPGSTPSQTVYSIHDPNTSGPTSITGENLLPLLARGGAIVGYQSTNFNFNKRYAIISVPSSSQHVTAEMEYDQTKVIDENINFGTSGITSISEINQARDIRFDKLRLTEGWNGNEQVFNGDSWNPANIKENQPWLEWSLWEFLNSKFQLYWYDSTKVISQGLNNTIIDFQYKMVTRDVPSGSSMVINIFYGDFITLQY